MKTSPLRSALQEQVKEWFASLEPVRPEDMIGLWEGDGHPSGHPLDGVLENLHWFGKRFHPDMRADALLFEGETADRLVAVDPVFFPIKVVTKLGGIGRSARVRNLFSHIRPRVRAKGTTARLELRMDDGAMTAAMVYDKQPIIDYFRKVDQDQVAGMMVVEGDERRFFFRLTRVEGSGNPSVDPPVRTSQT